MRKQTIITGVAGILVILLAAGGLMEISSRAGPYDQPIGPTAYDLSVDGTYSSRPPQGTTGPGGVCVPDGVRVCAPAQLDVVVSIAGLPRLRAPAAYVAFLTGDDSSLRLGALEDQGTRHSLEYRQNHDGRPYTSLLVTVEPHSQPSLPGPLVMFAADVRNRGQDAPAPLDAQRTAIPLPAHGHVRAAEIGAMSISVTAIGDLVGAIPVPGWEYAVWFDSHAPTRTFVHLGTLAPDDSGAARLDTRIETLRLEDQERLVITLEPTPRNRASGPVGLPVMATTFPN